jgi:hypothetical protein
MLNRTAKLAPAIFTGVLVGLTLTPISNHAAHAANDCLAGPKDQTPPGGHWYYRIDHATRRHCWYLGDEHEKLARAAPQTLTPSSASVSPRHETTPRSIADARAELPLPQRRFETPNSDDPTLPVKSADKANVENSQPASLSATNTQRSLVASRWPEPPGATVSVETGPNEADFVEPGGPTPRMSPAQTTAQRAIANASLATPA